MSAVATIGNFDGVHVGHQALIEKMLEYAGYQSLRAVLILFEPHPREFFDCTESPFRIQSLSDKLLKLKKWPIDCIHIIHFNAEIAQQSPAAFIEKTLRRLEVEAVVVGEDFRFGKNREGSRRELESSGISVITVPSVMLGNERVSSSRIRKELKQGNFKVASHLLGAPYVITGRVIHGAQQGRRLGFPTLNLTLRKKIPLAGVYAVKVHGLDKLKIGVANIGRRPSLNPLAHPLLEVYLLDYSEDAYRKRLTVEFVSKIRNEQKFTSLDALKAQINRDVQAVKNMRL